MIRPRIPVVFLLICTLLVGSTSASASTKPDRSAPTAPTGLTATPGNAQVTLSWSASSDNVQVTGYQVFRGSTLVTTVTSTSYTNTGLTNGTTYTFTVKARDAAGNVSLASNTATATPRAPGDTAPPSVAWSTPLNGGTVSGQLNETNANCRATATDDVSISKVDFYLDGAFLNTETSAPYSCIWDTTTAPNGSVHTFKAVAFDAAGNNSSASISVTVQNGPAADTRAPSAPTNLAATAGSGQVALSWGASSDDVGVTGYLVFRDGTQIATVTGTSYTNTGLVSGTAYTFTVKARDAAGNVSAASNSATATPTYTCTKTMPAGSTVQAFIDTLAPGDTGCLRGGTYTQSSIRFNRAGTSSSRITLASYPGERATLSGNFVYFPPGSHYTGIESLNIQGSGSPQVTMQVYASHVHIKNSDITNSNQAQTCIILSSYAAGSPQVSDVVIAGNKIHHCGSMANGAHDHGIYMANSLRAHVVDNLLYSNQGGWGIQLWTSAQYSVIEHNVLSDNESGNIIIGGSSENGFPASANNVFRYNILAFPDDVDGDYNVESYWWQVTPGAGNTVTYNCVFREGTRPNFDGGSGYTQSNNTIADPRFVDRLGQNFRLQSTSPCLSVVGYDTAARITF